MKQISQAEKEFARLLEAVGLGSVQAARVALNWKCEDGSVESQKARDLARSERVVAERKLIRAKLGYVAKAESVVVAGDHINVDLLKKYALNNLEAIRDDSRKPASARMRALNALEKLNDPSTETNLIYKWIDLVWRYTEAHCPACHTDFPTWKAFNPKLAEWRKVYDMPKIDTPASDLDRRMVGVSFADRRKVPHPGQIPFLAAPERHLVGLGAARSGKSLLMAYFAFLFFLLPGVEIWILARVYEDARSEHNYLISFLKTAFFPHDDKMIKTYEDKKTGELTLISKWGSELRIRSAKAKGSITGRELEAALVAEPGWVPEDLYEELRARMSSRLGRILAFGTPKGTAGFIGRMVKMTGRNPVTGQMVRRTPQERLISSGSSWNTSMFIQNLKPQDNPEFVLSEIEAARQELTDTEFASEFMGELTAKYNAKYPMVQENHLKNIPREFYQDAVFALGIDQGPKNFAAHLVAYDGRDVVCAWEYFDDSIDTMKRNLIKLNKEVPKWIVKLGGNPTDWQITIVDRNPSIDGILEELEQEGLPWPTPYTTTVRNLAKVGENWRRETSEFVNNLSAAKKLFFDMQHTYDIHDQVMNVEDKPLPMNNTGTESDKGWKVSDVWRGDHVLDAWLTSIYLIYSGHLIVPEVKPEANSVWEEHKAAFQFNLARDEAKELRGAMPDDHEQPSDAELYEDAFGRKGPTTMTFGTPGYYGDES